MIDWLIDWFLLFKATHVKVPRLGVKSELQLLPYTTDMQRRIWVISTTYTTAHGILNARYLTHWIRPGIDTASSWLLVGLATPEPQGELLNV